VRTKLAYRRRKNVSKGLIEFKESAEGAILFSGGILVIALAVILGYPLIVNAIFGVIAGLLVWLGYLVFANPHRTKGQKLKNIFGLLLITGFIGAILWYPIIGFLTLNTGSFIRNVGTSGFILGFIWMLIKCNFSSHKPKIISGY
jgi:hypothetical protein